MAAKFGAEVGAHVGGAKVFPAAARSLTRSLMRVWAPSRGSRAARAWPLIEIDPRLPLDRSASRGLLAARPLRLVCVGQAASRAPLPRIRVDGPW